MESHPVLFEVEKHIPQWLADYFDLANAGNYKYKQDFYSEIKPLVLKNYASPAGFDLQIIEHKCWSCDGTGVYKHYQYEFGQRYLIKQEHCNRCNEGVYQTKKIYLTRWLLNGKIYHIPRIDNIKVFPINNEIKGIIKHDPVDSDKALRAFIILLWRYNKGGFYDCIEKLVANEIKEQREKLIALIQSLFKRDNNHDELPF